MATEVTPVIEKIWKPFPKQEDFIRIPDTVFEGFFGGAAGPGKSSLIVMLPIIRQWYLNPNFHGIVFRRTFPELEESLIMESKKWFPYFNANWNDQKHTWTFPSGAVYRFSYMQRDDDARSHDTAQYNYIGFDELTHFTEFQYRYVCASRIRRVEKGLPVIVRSASNPGNVGHSWVRSRFVEPWRLGYKLLRDPKSGTLRMFIPGKLTDNPLIMENDPDYINRLRLLPLAEQKAKIDGDWWAYSGQVFNEFRTQHFPDEPSYACHVCEPFDIPDWWPKLIAIDWGYAAKTACYWGAVSPDGRLFIYREYVCSRKQIKVWAAEVLRASQFDGNIVGCTLDPSAWQNRGEDKLLWMQIQEGLGNIPVFQADNDRIGGKLALHEAFRWDKRPERYVPREGYSEDRESRIYRLSGQEAADGYRRLFDPDPPEFNLPKLQIFDRRCPELIDVIPSRVYDKPSKEGKLAEDVAETSDDDSYDCVRYLVKKFEQFVYEASEQFKEHQKRAEIMKLAKTDIDSFYREMEKLDATGDSDVVRPRLGYTVGNRRGYRAN